METTHSPTLPTKKGYVNKDRGGCPGSPCVCQDADAGMVNIFEPESVL